MPEIVLAHRTLPRLLAVLPAMVTAVAVRVLTLTTPALPVRLVAAAAIAVAAWTAYRLLTSTVTVTGEGLAIRGVLYDAQLRWIDIDAVDVGRANAGVRALVWGMADPHVLRLRCGKRTLRPMGATTHADDPDLERVVGAIRARLSTVSVPSQREDREHIPTG